MTFDGRKGINISYNILNLPEKISKGSQSILYIYSSAGEKLAMEFGSSLIYYRGGFIYSGNSLDRIIHEEGSVIKSSGGYNYYYALKDHIGSTRVLCKGSGTSLITEQTTEYYPFGLAFSYNSVDKNPYLFSGKEYQNEVIGGTKLELYDFGSRYYDTELGRWFAVDPALQLVSPYGYCMNNPVCCVDPDGEFAFLVFAAAVIGGGTNLWSNWNKVDNLWDGLGYFVSGAAGGAVAVVNPVLGGSIASGGNVLTDVLGGDIPDFSNPEEAFKYIGKTALDGVGIGGTGQYTRPSTTFSAPLQKLINKGSINVYTIPGL